MKKNYIFVGLLVLLGFSSCDPIEKDSFPYANYRIKVTVKNEEGQPIKGIEASSKLIPYFTLTKANVVKPITDENGVTTVAGQTPYFDLVEVRVYAYDRTAIVGGYLRDSASIILKKEDLKLGSGLNMGTADTVVTIIMKQGLQ